MNELTLKLKNEVVRQLIHNEQNLDVKYLHKGNMTYTRRELAAEIEAETILGIDLLAGMILLAIEISSKQK